MSISGRGFTSYDDMEKSINEALAAEVAPPSDLMQALSDFVLNATRNFDWGLALHLRGQYMKLWRKWRPALSGLASQEDRTAMLAAAGEAMAVMHDTRTVHGALLLENLAPNGALKNFGSVASRNPDMIRLEERLRKINKMDDPVAYAQDLIRRQAEIRPLKRQQALPEDVEWLAEDLVPLRYQLSAREWQIFRRAYLDAGTKFASAVIERVDRIITQDDVDKAVFGVPGADYSAPHFSVRLCTQLLSERSEALDLLRSRIQEAGGATDRLARLDVLLEVLLCADGLDWQIYLQGLDAVVEELRAARNEHYYVEMAKWCEGALSSLDGLTFHMPLPLFKGFIAAARAGLADDQNQSVLVEQAELAAAEMLSVNPEAWHCDVVDIVADAMQRVFEPAATIRLCHLFLPLVLEEVYLEGEERFLKRGADLARNLSQAQQQDAPFFSVCAELFQAQLAKNENRHGAVEAAVKKASTDNRVTRLLHRLHLPLPERKQPPDGPHGMSATVRQYISEHRWIKAANQLRVELDELENGQADTLACRTAAAALASMLQMCADFVPNQRRQLARQVQDLAGQYATAMLADTRVAPVGETTSQAVNANMLGWAATMLSPYLTEGEGQLQELAVQLLEEANRLTPAETCPEGFSLHANNLSVAYTRMAELVRDERLQYLQKARKLIERVIAVDQELLQSPDEHLRSVGESIHIDYNNLGNTCHALATATYQSTLISVKSPESARWYRQALNAYHRSSELADQRGMVEMAADAEKKAAGIYIELCNHYMQERYWSGGDLQRAFYDWICEFCGGHINTTLFSQWCALSALDALDRAASRSLHLNPALVMECLDGMVQLWSLGTWRQAFPAEFVRHILVTLLETIDKMDVSGMLSRYSDELTDVPTLREFWRALLSLEAFRAHVWGTEPLETAYAFFAQLSDGGTGVVRALARPYQRAVEFVKQPDGLQVTGLFLRRTTQGIELRMPAQRRSIYLEGLRMQALRPTLGPTGYLRDVCTANFVHLKPMFNWDDLPAEVLVGTAMGTLGEEQWGLEIMRLPTGSWDAWLLRMQLSQPSKEPLRCSLPFIGVYDLESGRLDTSFPAQIMRQTQLLLFAEQGITMEISLDIDNPDAGWQAAIHVGNSPEHPEISVANTAALACVIKAAPRVASADAAFIVKQDRSIGASCCAASFSQVTPSISFPASALHSFGPLFFFDQQLPADAADFLNRVNPHEMILVGAPQDEIAAARLLELLFDPRRDLFWLVTEDEASLAEAAVDALRDRISSVPGARYLLRAAASSTYSYNPREHIQIYVAPRDMTAAVSQIALDLAALRRYDIENIPVIIDGQTQYLNIKGNPLSARLEKTLFNGPVNCLQLMERYRDLSTIDPLGKMVYASKSLNDATVNIMMPQLPQRPLFFVPGDSPTAIAAIPFARLLGAMLVPFNEMSLSLLKKLEPSTVYVTTSLADRIPSGAWSIEKIPDDCREIALHHQAFARREYAQLMDKIDTTHPHLLGSKDLLMEMQPSEYVVMGVEGKNESGWNYVAANYAATIFAPLYLLKESVASQAKQLGMVLNFLSGPPVELRGVGDSVRHLYREEVQRIPNELSSFIQEATMDLGEMNPLYLGWISSLASFPLELMGAPPLATRFAVGRLSGPDLESTSLLVARAAFSEGLNRAPNIHSLLAECHDAVPERTLPGARLEAEELERLLRENDDVQVLVINDQDDLTRFLDHVLDANIVHFTGHGRYDEEHPENSGLIFREGVLKPQQLDLNLSGAPIVFGNACETGLLANAADQERQSWVGLAASFIAKGATNYLGSLWPIYDESSRRFAGIFYKEILRGETVGAALLKARKDAFDRNDTTWAAFALFGCPRNRLRAGRRGQRTN